MTLITALRGAAPSFTDLAAHAGRPALVVAGQEMGYMELDALVAEAEHRLGDERRLVLLPAANELAPIVWYLAAIRSGCPVLLAAPGAAADALVAAYDPDVVIHQTAASHDHLGDLDVRRTRTEHALHPELAVLLSTSGSTGSPRLVRLSHRNLDANARAIAGYLDLTSDDRAVTSLPMHYCYGLSVLHSHLLVGASLTLTDTSVVDPCFWDLFRSSGATSFAGVPHTFDLLDRVGFESMDLPTLRYATQAGGRLEPQQVERYAALGERDGWELFVMYGQTEATARMAYLPPALARTAPTAIGVPVPGGAFEIVPADGGPPDEGRLLYRGPNVMLGYATQPSDLAVGATVDALDTGDLARRRSDGLFEIVGRASRFVKLFGLRIDLDQVEHTLARDGVAALCAGDDRGLVLAVEGGHDPIALQHRLAENLGLPRGSIDVRPVDALPLLPNGKPDRASLRTVPAEVAPAPPSDLRALFSDLLGASDLRDDDTFVSAGGDSLAYVEMSIALEQRLGTLPEGWHLRPLAELEARPRQGRRMGRIEVGVLMRAVAITVVVANHGRLVHLAGTAHVLLGVAGFNFARFQLASGRLVRSALRVAVPSMLIIGVAAVTRDDFDLVHALLLRGPFGAEGERWGYWFVEALVHLLAACALLLSIPAVRRLQDRHPVRLALGVLALGLAIRFDAVGLPTPEHAIFRAHELLWVFAVGWAASVVRTVPHRLLVSAAALAAANDFFADPARNALLAGGLLVLVWVRVVPLPRILSPLVGALAGTSLYVYLVHWQVLPLLRSLPAVVAVLAAIAGGVLVGHAARRVTPAVEAAIERAVQRAAEAVRS